MWANYNYYLSGKIQQILSRAIHYQIFCRLLIILRLHTGMPNSKYPNYSLGIPISNSVTVFLEYPVASVVILLVLIRWIEFRIFQSSASSLNDIHKYISSILCEVLTD